MVLVHVLEVCISCHELHFLWNLQSDFWLWCFWADFNHTNSSNTSFRVCLSVILNDFDGISKDGYFDTWFGNDGFWKFDSVQRLMVGFFVIQTLSKHHLWCVWSIVWGKLVLVWNFASWRLYDAKWWFFGGLWFWQSFASVSQCFSPFFLNFSNRKCLYL